LAVALLLTFAPFSPSAAAADETYKPSSLYIELDGGNNTIGINASSPGGSSPTVTYKDFTFTVDASVINPTYRVLSLYSDSSSFGTMPETNATITGTTVKVNQNYVNGTYANYELFLLVQCDGGLILKEFPSTGTSIGALSLTGGKKITFAKTTETITGLLLAGINEKSTYIDGIALVDNSVTCVGINSAKFYLDISIPASANAPITPMTYIDIDIADISEEDATIQLAPMWFDVTISNLNQVISGTIPDYQILPYVIATDNVGVATNVYTSNKTYSPDTGTLSFRVAVSNAISVLKTAVKLEAYVVVKNHLFRADITENKTADFKTLKQNKVHLNITDPQKYGTTNQDSYSSLNIPIDSATTPSYITLTTDASSDPADNDYYYLPDGDFNFTVDYRIRVENTFFPRHTSAAITGLSGDTTLVIPAPAANAPSLDFEIPIFASMLNYQVPMANVEISKLITRGAYYEPIVVPVGQGIVTGYVGMPVEGTNNQDNLYYSASYNATSGAPTVITIGNVFKGSVTSNNTTAYAGYTISFVPGELVDQTHSNVKVTQIILQQTTQKGLLNGTLTLTPTGVGDPIVVPLESATSLGQSGITTGSSFNITLPQNLPAGTYTYKINIKVFGRLESTDTPPFTVSANGKLVPAAGLTGGTYTVDGAATPGAAYANGDITIAAGLPIDQLALVRFGGVGEFVPWNIFLLNGKYVVAENPDDYVVVVDGDTYSTYGTLTEAVKEGALAGATQDNIKKVYLFGEGITYDPLADKLNFPYVEFVGHMLTTDKLNANHNNTLNNSFANNFFTDAYRISNFYLNTDTNDNQRNGKYVFRTWNDKAYTGDWWAYSDYLISSTDNTLYILTYDNGQDTTQFEKFEKSAYDYGFPYYELIDSVTATKYIGGYGIYQLTLAEPLTADQYITLYNGPPEQRIIYDTTAKWKMVIGANISANFTTAPKGGANSAFTIEAGESFDVTPYITITPAKAKYTDLHLELADSWGSDPAISVDGLTITGLKGGTAYFYIYLTDELGKERYISGIAVTVEQSLDSQGLEFGDTDIQKEFGDDNFTNVATNTSVDGGTITYTSGDTTVATVDPATGEVTIVGAGTTTITATAAKVNDKWAATSVTYTLSVSAKALEASDVGDIVGSPFTYSGAGQTPTVTVSGLTLGTDYTVAFANNTNAGTASATVSGIGNYSGTVSKTFTIDRADYAYVIDGTQSIKYGRTIASADAPEFGTGVNSQDVAGTLTWYKGDDELESTDIIATEDQIDDTVTLTWKFVTTDPNYVNTIKTGTVGFEITDGDQQSLSFATDSVEATYGDTPPENTATLSVGGGAVTYSATGPVTIDPTTGEVTITGIGTATITATAAVVPGEWKQATDSYQITISAKLLTIANITATDRPYDGSLNVEVSGGTLVGVVNSDDVGFTLGTGAVVNKLVGEGKVVTITGSELTGTNAFNYSLSSFDFPTTSVNITPKTIILEGVTATNRAYDVDNTSVELSGGTLSGAVVDDEVGFTLGSGTIVTADVGDGKAVTTNITLTGTDAGNYTLTQPVYVIVDITKGTIETTAKTLNVLENISKTYTVDLSSLLPDGIAATAYAIGTIADSDEILSETPTIAGAVLTVVTNDTAVAGNIATIPITFTSSNDNYDIAVTTITIVVTDKTPVTITSADIADKVYNGQAATYSATFSETVPADDIVYTWSSGTAPVNVGEYTLTVTLTAASEYILDSSEAMTFSITPALLTITAANKSMSAGASLPAFTYTVSGLIGSDTLITEPTVTTEATGRTAGTYSIIITGGEASDNYEITNRVNGTLTVTSVTIRDDSYNGNNGSDNSSGASDSIKPSDSGVKTEIDKESGLAEAIVEPTVTITNGAANVTISDSEVKASIDAAKEAAKAVDTSGVVTVKIDAQQAGKLEVDLSASALSEIAESGVTFKFDAMNYDNDGKVDGGVGSVGFDTVALQTISGAAENSTDTIKVTVANVDLANLSEEHVRTLGENAKVVDFAVTVGDKPLTDFGGGVAYVQVPYEIPAGTQTISIGDIKYANVVVHYLKADGTIESVTCMWNSFSDSVMFPLRHFSRYAVSVSDLKFEITGGWHNETLNWAAYNGLLDKYLIDGKIDASAKITRGDFIAAYMKANNIAPIEKLTVEPFADVSGANAAYINTAKELGIISGIDAEHKNFNPDGAATREQEYAIIYNFLQAGLGTLSKTDTGKTIADFADGNNISEWYVTAANALIKSGFVVGDGKNLNGKDTFTVGTLSVVLSKVVE
jgi:hypothetical protein